MDNSTWALPTHIIAVAGVVINEKNEILMVNNNRRGWEIPGGIVEVGENVIDGLKREVMEETGIDIEVGELFCISSNTCKYAGYNGVKEIPTKIMLDFICRVKGGLLRSSDENLESVFIPKNEVLCKLQTPAITERFKAYLDYYGRPTYLEYITKPSFQLKLKLLV